MTLTQNEIAGRLSARKTGDPPPARLQIFKLGQNESNQGNFVVDAQCLASLAASQRSIGRERVPIGFEHNIDEGSDEYKRTQEPRQIAGYGDVQAVDGQGIFLNAITWNRIGEQNLDQYEDLSPTPIFDKKTRRVLAIASASLTRAGSIYGLTLENAAAARLSAALDDTRAAQDPTLTGLARVTAVFERQNARERSKALYVASLAAYVPGASRLTGMARVIAAFEAENAANKRV